MASRVLLISAFIYGYNEIRLEADLALPVPAEVSMTDETAHKYQLARVIADLKHSYPMTCEYCGKPAMENHLNFASWSHLPPKGQMWMGRPSPGPMGNAYIHAVCSMSGDCGKMAQGMGNWLGGLAIATGTPPERTKIQMEDMEPIRFPKNGSCAYCQTDESIEKPKSRCSKCKATQYCGPACQKSDWSRHKVTCKWIRGIRFVDEHGEMTVWKENPDPIVRN
ncbi:hypothetical protein DENSPDRAFT_841777 [Dentipellis sp. KUC8613]|nr:hypothetical protein DENSPDRAFT_841777 [Dentipellis sp. KUC8613]